MDYVVGSIAALLSGNVTPNRPKHLKKAHTPIKHQLSPNVTPKSEFVEDRSIFLSPTMLKKKDIIKKSPKRIFENPDLDVTNGEDDSSVLSPKAEKVKKALKDNLEASSISDNFSVQQKVIKNNEKSPKKANKKRLSNIENTYGNLTPKNKLNISVTGNDAKDDTSTLVSSEKSPKKKGKESKLSSSSSGVNAENSQEHKGISKKMNNTNDFTVEEINSNNENQSPKKKNKKIKQNSSNNENESVVNVNSVSIINNNSVEGEVKVLEKKNNGTNIASVVNQGPKKKNKKRNKSKQKKNNSQIELTSNLNQETNENSGSKDVTVTATADKNAAIASTQNGNPKQKNKNKNKQIQGKDQTEAMVNFVTVANMEVDSDNENETENHKVDNNTSTENQSPKKKNKKKKKKSKPIKNDEQVESTLTQNDNVNPNAVTNQDTDSEHDSDDEMVSENEEINIKALDTGPADDSSDEDAGKEIKKPEKKSKKNSTDVKTGGSVDDETKRTLFVGNVLFSSKCKKEIKKIFNQYGQIESVRIRTVPVKDARDTPKLAVIKKELHPDRTTVNVYVRFADADSVKKALVENNTVLNGNHLRVQPSDTSGVPHDTKCSVFVGNIPFALEDEALRAKFDKCGAIDSVRIVRDKKTCAGKGFGYVNFKSKDGVELALALPEEDLTIKNRILRVKRCTQPTQNQLTKKGKFISQKQPDRQEAGQFGRGKFGGRPNDRFGKGQNDRFGNRQNDRIGKGQNDRFGKGQNDRFGNGQNDRFGKGQNDRFGKGQNDGFGKGQNFRQQETPGNKVGNFGRATFGDGQNADKNNGAYRRVMNKRKNQESGEGPPNKRQNVDQPPKEKKERKEFVGMTAEKKKKNKFDKGLKKKKILSEILTK